MRRMIYAGALIWLLCGAMGCCWRPWWCQNHPMYGDPHGYGGQPQYGGYGGPVYQQPMYAPANDCSCF